MPATSSTLTLEVYFYTQLSVGVGNILEAQKVSYIIIKFQYHY